MFEILSDRKRIMTSLKNNDIIIFDDVIIFSMQGSKN